MNKRYLGIGLFFVGCSLYSLFRAFRLDFDFVSLTLACSFGFLASVFLRHSKR